MMVSQSRADSIFKYLEIIQSLPMYSMHYFDVKVRRYPQFGTSKSNPECPNLIQGVPI